MIYSALQLYYLRFHYLHYVQGRKSMFKHGGDNIVEKYTIRLRDELRGATRPVFLGGFGGMPPPPQKKKFKWCNLVSFGVYLDRFRL